MQVDLGAVAFERGGAMLLRRALRLIAPGEVVMVAGDSADLLVHLRAWCRVEGHVFDVSGGMAQVRAGVTAEQRWLGAERAGSADGIGVVGQPPQRWGLAARGALVEAGSPEYHFALQEKLQVWSDDAARLYAQAAAAQWDPATAIPWSAAVDLPDEVEDAVVQVMTYLIENETAALLVPS